jgi:hypothetical protein
MVAAPRIDKTPVSISVNNLFSLMKELTFIIAHDTTRMSRAEGLLKDQTGSRELAGCMKFPRHVRIRGLVELLIVAN